MSQIPYTIDHLTPAWLSDALGRTVTAVSAERVGTGQIGTCYRLTLSGEGVPQRLIAKLPAEDAATRDMLAGTYRGEVRFYRDLAATVTVRVPACHHAASSQDSGAFVLLLEDLAPAVQGDQLGGCTAEEARDAVVNLAGLHGPRWCDPTLLEVEGLALNGPDDAAILADLYGPATETFLGQVGPLLSAQDHATLRACVPVIADWALARSERFSLVHGDYRLDNLMFPADGGPGVVAVDWQTLSLALPARDLAFFLGTSLDPVVRRERERDLVAAYHDALAVADYPVETCWDDYVFAMLQGPLIAVFGCAYGVRSERGDRMFAAMAARSCTAIRDLGSLD